MSAELVTTIALAAFVLGLAGLLGLVSLVQFMYLEALRFRPRETPAFEYFRSHLEERLGLKLERGALAYSLIKHSTVLLLGVTYVYFLLWRSHTPLSAVLEALLVTWFSMMVFAYLGPQLVYRRSQAHWLVAFVPLLKVLAILVSPLIFLLEFFQSLADLTDAQNGHEETAGPEENIDALISAGEEEGLIEENERKLIESVIAFRHKTAREAMTPRPKIVAMAADRSLLELRDLVGQAQYSRVPIYRQSIDNIEGFVRIRDLVKLKQEHLARTKVAELMRPVKYVPETKRIDELLRELQSEGAHMAVVIDEYGNTAGLITLEDLIEELIGEIRDEHEPDLDVIGQEDGSFVVAGNVDVDLLDELFEFRPDEDTESTTVGGLVTEWLGRVPKPGETVEREGLRIEILASNDLKVEQVRIARAAVPQDA